MCPGCCASAAIENNENGTSCPFHSARINNAIRIKNLQVALANISSDDDIRGPTTRNAARRHQASVPKVPSIGMLADHAMPMAPSLDSGGFDIYEDEPRLPVAVTSKAYRDQAAQGRVRAQLEKERNLREVIIYYWKVVSILLYTYQIHRQSPY